jgi:hypothetical protein
MSLEPLVEAALMTNCEEEDPDQESERGYKCPQSEDAFATCTCLGTEPPAHAFDCDEREGSENPLAARHEKKADEEGDDAHQQQRRRQMTVPVGRPDDSRHRALSIPPSR